MRGQLKEILVGLNERINGEQMDLGGIYEIEFLSGLVRIYSVAFLDESSFYSPSEGKKSFTPAALTEKEPDEKYRQEKLRKMMEKMQRVLSPEKIDKYVKEQLGERKEMLASQLPLETAEDFVKVIYVRLYGQRKNMSYSVGVREEKELNGFVFRDFLIQRKG